MRASWIVGFMLTWRGLAAAEPPRPAPADLHYRFDDDKVVGTDQDPMIERLLVRKRGGRGSLIEVKTSLVPELLKSVEDL